MSTPRGQAEVVRASLAVRLVAGVLAVQVIFISAIVFDLVRREGATLERNRIERARGFASVLATTASSSIQARDRAKLSGIVRSVSDTGALQSVTFLDARGRVLASSENSARGNIPMSALESLASAQGLVVTRTRNDVDVLAGATRDGRVVGAVQVRVNLDAARKAERDLGRWGASYGIAAALLGLLVSLLVARGITRRLEALSSVSHRFRLGDHEVRATDAGTDEIAHVARGFNRMLDAVVASERALNETQLTAKIGTWEYDSSTGQSTWSDATFELFGFSRDEGAPGLERFLKTLSGKDAQELRQILTADQTPELGGIKLTITRPDGEQRICWLEARVRQVPGELRRIFYGTCQDITDRETAAAQLRQAQKMEAVGQLTGGISHDFNNLLAIIIGNLDFLQDEITDQAQRESLEEALGAALRGAELTRQLLTFSRRQPLSVQLLDLNERLSGMASLWKRTIGPEIKVKLRLAKKLWPVRTDPTQLEAALLNLVINARDAMPAGGQLTVETQNLRAEEPIPSGLEGEDLPPAEYVMITVTDTGQGMSQEIVTRAFEPFFTTKPAGRGTGLGLSMIYGFAKQAGGQTRIHSEVGQGTSVTIFLPRAVPSTRPDKTPDQPAGQTNGKVVLLVDDDPGILQVAARQLRELGYTVITAESGEEALAKLSRNPDVDLLLTDIVMPGGMNGFELSERALAISPDIKVLHASGFTLTAGDQDAASEGSNPILSKPYRKADLAAKLRHLLDAAVEEPS
jgi:PAS domain S-box-containing protein